MSDFAQKLKHFFHDPIDKCLDIPRHKIRAQRYSQILGIKNLEQASGSDQIASCMERSFIPDSAEQSQFYQSFTEVRHPLSEGEIKIKDLEDIDTVSKKLQELFEEMEVPFDDKEKFIYLWRNLVELAYLKFKDTNFGKYLAILPADTRLPDHSIWEHLKITSAINSSIEKSKLFQNNSLFVMSIGPVQDFISQARKAQDFFMGSFLLSYLTFKAISKVVDRFGPTNIIYPDMHGQPLMDYYLKHDLNIEVINSFDYLITQPTIPNRFVAFLPMTDIEKIRELADEIEKTVKYEWLNIVKVILRKFRLLDVIKGEIIVEQNKNFPEIYWSAIPLKIEGTDLAIDDLAYFFDGTTIEEWKNLMLFLSNHSKYPINIGLLYQLAYSALEKSMGARKNLRNFEQTNEYGRKCSLCGEKQGVISAEKGTLKVGKYISATESLCTTCFTKRALERYLEDIFGDIFKSFYFPSTAEIAVSDFKKRALKNAKKEFKEYMETVAILFKKASYKPFVSFLPNIKKEFRGLDEDFNIEGSLFFEETLTKKEFKEEYGICICDKTIKVLKEKLKFLTEKAGKPCPYYSVIKLDGDNMGKWLSGENLPEIKHAYNSEIWAKLPKDFKEKIKVFPHKKILTPSIHASISNALRNYTLEFVRYIVEEEHLGKLVYSGGDDVLAFVNLKDLIPVIQKLRAAFSGHIKFNNKELTVDWSNDTGFVIKDEKYILTMGPNSSASCGVVIAHFKTPLKLVIDKVNQMEEKAKAISGKDAFAVSLIKHSGQLKEFYCKWKFEKGGELIDTNHKILNLINYFKERGLYLSNTFPYKLYNSVKNLMSSNGGYSLDSGIFKSELQRIVKRSLQGDSQKISKKDFVENVVSDLWDLFFIDGISENIERFTDLLEIARFLSKVVV